MGKRDITEKKILYCLKKEEKEKEREKREWELCLNNEHKVERKIDFFIYTTSSSERNGKAKIETTRTM